MDIEFKNPPSASAGTGGHDHEAIAAALVARPGEWALLFPDAYPAIAMQIKSGRYKAYRPAGSFEAVTRRKEKGAQKADIYARYVGEVSA